MTFALVLLAIVIGATAQRVTGFGFALAVSPALVLLLGPFDGVLIVNLCGAVSAAIILLRVWKRVDWSKYVLLVVPALIGVVVGALVATALPGPPLEIGIAVLVLVALTASLLVSRADVTLTGAPPAVAAGFASGFMNATAGVGGPAISIYSLLTRWEHSPFAATLQPYFLTIGSASLVSKLLLAGGRVPDLLWWQWAAIVVGILVGLAIGEVVSARISHTAARRAVIVVAYVGAAAALVHGMIAAGA